MKGLAKEILSSIQKLSDPVKSEWQENYVKHNTKAYGVGIPDIRKIIENSHQLSD